MACSRVISNSARSLALLASVGLSGVACGDDDGRASDAAQEQFSLEVLAPPGDAIGLAFNESIELRVRYSGQDDRPLRDRQVEFSIVAVGGESVGGSALSATQNETNREGIASVELVAGAEGAGFRVAVTAPQATQATFFVSVSDQGFTRLLVEPIHMGPRSSLAFSQVDVRLYRPSELRCPDADPDALPDSLFPPRSVPTFLQVAEFVNVASGVGYTVVAWATVEDSATPLTFGCIELGESQTRNFDVELLLTTQDRPVAMDGPAQVESTFNLAPVIADGGDAQTLWSPLACPLGPGQLLVECVADALVDDGELDCDFQGTGALANKIRAERGTADASGCRPASAGGSDSIDKIMQDAVEAGGSFPTGSALADVLTIRDSIAGQLVVRSELQVFATAAQHRLVEAEVGTAPAFVVDLSASNRPLLEQSFAASTTPMGSAAPLSSLSTHGFTLDYGSIAGEGFQSLALTPASLDGVALGTALSASAESGMLTACEAVSDVLCTAVAEPSNCAQSACATAATHLDGALVQWWTRLADLGGVDFQLEGELILRDSDNDLVVDSVGRDAAGEITGGWTATMTTEDGQVADIGGSGATP